MTSWADRKAQVRRQVHQTFAVRCIYSDAQQSAVELTARLHSRILAGGNSGLGSGYAQTIEGVDSVVFDKELLAAANVTLRRRGNVSFPDYGSNFRLEAQDTDSGPVIEKWSLADS